jgi:hypothetical protein
MKQLAIALLCLTAAACGSSNERAKNAAGGTARATAASGARGGGAEPGFTLSAAPHLRGDEDDDDDVPHNTAEKGDQDADFDHDTTENSHKGYHDRDDQRISAFGHAAGPADMRAIATLFERYQAAATANDGARVCALIYTIFQKAIPEDYGRAPGPVYARGGTCSAVMTKILQHTHSHFSVRWRIASTRVGGNSGFLLLGSKNAPASYLVLHRERAAWRIGSLVIDPLP